MECDGLPTLSQGGARSVDKSGSKLPALHISERKPRRPTPQPGALMDCGGLPPLLPGGASSADQSGGKLPALHIPHENLSPSCAHAHRSFLKNRLPHGLPHGFQAELDGAGGTEPGGIAK